MGGERKRRVSPDEFCRLVSDFTGGRVSGFRFSELENYAEQLRINIPTVIRTDPQYKERRGVFTLVSNGEDFEPIQEKLPAGENGTDALDIIVHATTRDPFGRYRKATPNQIQHAVQKRVGNSLPSLAPVYRTQNEINDPDELFDHLTQLVKMVVKGDSSSLMVYGGTGTGKTWTVKSTIEKACLKLNQDWFFVKGKTAPMGIYSLLFQNRNKLIVFDDSDSAWRDKESTNILKAALDDTYDERPVTWASTRTISVIGLDKATHTKIEEEADAGLAAGDEKVKLPSQFLFTGRIIFISNLTRDRFDEAVLGRGFKIDMSLGAPAMFQRLESILEKIGGPKFADVSLAKRKEILRVLKEKHETGELIQPNLRSFVQALRISRTNPKGWLKLMRYS